MVREKRWYQATTLTERVATLAKGGIIWEGDQLATATEHLKDWKKLSIFEDPTIFAERLQVDALTEQDLLLLLSEPVEQLQKRMEETGIPLWIDALEQALTCLDTETYSAAPPQEQVAGQPTLASVFKPLIDTGRKHLQEGLFLLSEEYPHLPFEATTLLDLLQESLLVRLHSVALRALILEMHVARLQGQLAGETPEARFNDFLVQLCQRDHLRAFLLEYPVLARHLHRIVTQWASTSLELLGRLCADWAEICADLHQDRDPGQVIRVEVGAGDAHRGGRSVAILQCSSGFRFVYKPRSLSLDQHFQEVLAWLNTQGLAHPFRTVTIVNKGSYGWSEFIEAHSCTTEDEIWRFYERQGYYLALFYALRAGDFHHENILAAGEHPMLIDLEALFHPQINVDKDAPLEAAATRSMSSSVLSSGLLPQHTYLEEGEEGIDFSGLGGQRGQFASQLVWKEARTDQMHLKREQVELAEQQNRPRLRGEPVAPLAYEASLLKGFTQMYHLLIKQREAFLTQLLPPFAHDETRVILRSTRNYVQLLSEMTHPERLFSAIEGEKLLNVLWLARAYQPYLRRVLAAECQDVREGDVPIFTSQPASRDVFTSRGERIADFCAESGLEFVRRRIQQMDSVDLALQQWIIKGTLATTMMEVGQWRNVPLHPPSEAEVTREQLLQAACAVGDRLQKLALTSGQGCNWYGIALTREIPGKTCWDVQPVEPLKLYDGIAGIVLFLSYLGAVTGERTYKDLAKQALATIQEQCEQLFPSGKPLKKGMEKALRIGAFDGLGSLIYLYTHLSVLWQDPSYSEAAEGLVRHLEALIEHDNQPDIIAGAAGCIASLLSFYKVTASAQSLAVAMRCGEHLLSRAQPMPSGIGWQTIGEKPFSGFSHGASGIALSLLRVAAASGEERFHQAGREALSYERSLFLPARGNWAHTQDAEGEESSLTWCYGAPGIGLARLGMLTYLDEVQIRQEIEIALETTLKYGFGSNQSLCHGDLGNLETVLSAAQILEEPRYRKALTHLTAQVVGGIGEHGWVTGVPQGTETPGLMTGLAGIGYQLMRLAEPDKIPAILLLEPPSARWQGGESEFTEAS